MKKIHADKMTLQEQVDYIGERLAMQGKKCMADEFIAMCAYGNGKGNHCAIGWLLDTTDEELMNWKEGVSGLVKEFKEKLPSSIYTNEYMFADLQTIHDNADDPIGSLCSSINSFKEKFPEITLNEHWYSFIKQVNGE